MCFPSDVDGSRTSAPSSRANNGINNITLLWHADMIKVGANTGSASERYKASVPGISGGEADSSDDVGGCIIGWAVLP